MAVWRDRQRMERSSWKPKRASNCWRNRKLEEPADEVWLPDILLSAFWPPKCEWINFFFVILSHHICSDLLEQPYKTNTEDIISWYFFPNYSLAYNSDYIQCRCSIEQSLELSLQFSNRLLEPIRPNFFKALFGQHPPPSCALTLSLTLPDSRKDAML